VRNRQVLVADDDGTTVQLFAVDPRPLGDTTCGCARKAKRPSTRFVNRVLPRLRCWTG